MHATFRTDPVWNLPQKSCPLAISLLHTHEYVKRKSTGPSVSAWREEILACRWNPGGVPQLHTTTKLSQLVERITGKQSHGHSKESCREGDILLHQQLQEVTFLPVIYDSKWQKNTIRIRDLRPSIIFLLSN
jgi:hypothetical protein